jgi:hypothetical protein
MRSSAASNLTRMLMLVLGACAIALLPSSAAAQQVGGGVKVGVTFSDIPNFDQLLDLSAASTSQRVGWAGGGFLMVRYKNGLAIQPEFLYTQKGVKVQSTGTTIGEDFRVKLDFLDVPVLARYTVGKGIRGYVFAGPSFDFKLSAKVKSSGPGGVEEDISSDVKTFEFAVVFGGGVELGPVLLEARWSEGLTNLDTASGGGSPSIKTRTFLVLGGLRF